MVQSISASQFKARCLGLMDEVARSGEPLVITKNGVPVAELHPTRGTRRPTPFGLHPSTRLIGDVVAPLNEPWSALE
ncbi:type II toxin-antitoxin system Phd/YefM family antitoxin [Vulcanococcus sp.]|jgi:prevent-host-death family protein|uniref:type II toxin-antitoxin system Phd/YefM family antitoxin n=1 Tax=Vulcanococcus sp. TaxID=2856995 RepID=UPI0037DA6D4E